ncbi:helix-loop-helix protein delilah-like [Cylas formicarius]|uniref:helix-loop-helix protein delilah-like n=1 Tax=Cylas formicarius TaxID=197179 RepID=UPI002958DF76|nr:helix-loop-helix protein delilah-like [Cylas formicarius]
MNAVDTMDSLLNYSELRERLSSEATFTDDNNNSDASCPKEDKYSLRPRSMRKITELAKEAQLETHSKQINKSHAKQKQKAAPLSKYRRKTANARERNRMREINQAFETLRMVIPHMQAPTTSSNEKLTKITTLRLAMKYINALSSALNNPMESEFVSTDYSDLDCLLLESDGESLSLSDHSGSLLASPDFLEPSLSPVDFSDPSLPALLHTDFTEHALEAADLNDFLLT